MNEFIADEPISCLSFGNALRIGMTGLPLDVSSLSELGLLKAGCLSISSGPNILTGVGLLVVVVVDFDSNAATALEGVDG